ncbi:MAG TPA: hypothetical protein VLT33_46165 [Labilithrix sp.]|nr:hypothetical protein [Labilithrix sp.]
MAKLCIVLVDPLGDVLFSGESVMATAPPPPVAVELDLDEACPETKRSATSESGIFASVRTDQDAVDTLPEQNPDEIRSSRPRAA